MNLREAPNGVTHDHFDWSPIVGRPPIEWPDQRRLAVCVVVSIEYFEAQPPSGTFQTPDGTLWLGHRPSPDIPTLSHRAYGHRVGVFRVLDALRLHGIRPTVAIDAISAEKYPFEVEECARSACEFVAHGIAATRVITNALEEDEENAYITTSLERVSLATGVTPVGWLSPSRSESVHTPQLLASHGLRYVCDWSNDEQPYRMTTRGGELLALPMSLELEDTYACVERGMPINAYGAMVIEAINELESDREQGGRLLALHVHPWLIGQPFRIGTFEGILRRLAQSRDIWLATGREIVDWYAGVSSQ